jgi:methyltransferase (TIGR00027 family)
VHILYGYTRQNTHHNSKIGGREQAAYGVPVESLSGATRTALGAARTRAEESRRPDRIFDDPFAELFLAAAGPALPDRPTGAEGIGALLALHVTIRTRFYDDYLAGAGCRQVVLVAAGLDARAYRLTWPPGVRLFEIDLPEVLTFKDGVLRRHGAEPRCERVALMADLRGEWPAALVAAGFRPEESTAWLVEGVLIYLSAEEANGLFTGVTGLSAPGSRLAFEHGDVAESPLIAKVRDLPAMSQFAAMLKGGLGAEAPKWLDRHGWQVDIHKFADVAASAGRAVPDSSYGGFITARL